MLDVFIINPQEILYQGKAKRVILPGEQGVFEVLPYHKPLVSRIFTGNINVDDKAFPIKRGVVKVEEGNRVTIIIEHLGSET